MTVKHCAAPRRLSPFYPIVPDSAWLARLAPLDVKTVQLRLKDLPAEHITHEISAALAIAEKYAIQLIINDFWQQAIALGASYVHLGQDDIALADVAAIKAAGLRLGLSTHSEAELATAMAVNPDYIALGPVFETKLKAMPWAPQGLERIRSWREKIGQMQLVAIGGLTPERATAARDAGADSCAVITDFLTHADPESRVRDWVAWETLAETRESENCRIRQL